MPDPTAKPVLIDPKTAADVHRWMDLAAMHRRDIDRLNDDLDVARRDLARSEAEIRKLQDRSDAAR